MRLAILADIHANAPALEAVLEDAAQKGITRFVVAGDLVGYYYWPAKVLELLSAVNCCVVRGNHEDLYKEWLSGDDRETLLLKYGSGFLRAEEQLCHGSSKWLDALPTARELRYDDHTMYLCHANPNIPGGYVYPDAEESSFLSLSPLKTEIVVYGHTHYPVLRKIDGQLFINPGSVGQPRNRVPGAHWVSFDFDTMTAEPHIAGYDIESVAAQCRIGDPQMPYLADVLLRR